MLKFIGKFQEAIKRNMNPPYTKERFDKVKLTEVNEEINRLQKVRQELHKEALLEVKEEFLKLEWAQDTMFIFREGTGPYGHTEYILFGVLPEKYGNINNSQHQIYGTSKNYMDNVMMRSSRIVESLLSFEFYCSNEKTFSEFMHKYVTNVSLPYKFKERCEFYNSLLKFDEVGGLERVQF